MTSIHFNEAMTTDRAATVQNIRDIFSILNEPVHAQGHGVQGTFEQKAARWSRAMLTASGVLFCLLLTLAIIHSIVPFDRSEVIAATILGLLIQVLSIGSIGLHVAGEIVTQVVLHRRIGEADQAEFLQDDEFATRLAAHSPENIAEVDRWIELKLKRMERRQVRFFGGSDKLALTVVAVAAWAAWEKLGAMHLDWTSPSLMFGAALLVGLVFGGMMVSRRADKLLYQRDLLQTAKALAIERQSGTQLPDLNAGT